MARANIKIYINEECVRNWGGNKSTITKHIADLKRADMDSLEEMYPQLKEGDDLRYSVLYKKRRNKLYRLLELIDRLTIEEMTSLIERDLLTEDLMKLEYAKLDEELVFSENGSLMYNVENKESLLNGYIKKETVKKFGEFFIVKSILFIYKVVQ